MSDVPDKLAAVRDKLAQSQKRQRDLSEDQTTYKSLYDILQENKAREDEYYQNLYMQRNAVHKLDDRDVEYLESLRRKEGEKDDAMKREVEQRLLKFRKLKTDEQEEATTPVPVLLKGHIPSKIVKKRKNKSGLIIKKSRDDAPKRTEPKNESKKDVMSTHQASLSEKIQVPHTTETKPTNTKANVEEKSTGSLLSGYESDDD
jgi:hypothetical protein